MPDETNHNPPDPSAPLGTVPNPAATFGSVSNSSEPVRTVPHPAETFRTLRHHAERGENHTLTVREVARLFEASGVARTERSIVNWCQPNRTGVARLDAYFDPNERKYYLTRESVDLAIAEELAKAAKNAAQPGPAAGFGTVPNESTDSPPRPAHDTGPTEDDAELRREVLDLKIANRAKDMFIEQLKQEREHFTEERREYVERLMSFNRQVGELETHLRQLGTGSREATGDDTSAAP
ncbi:MAG: hypothetical protein HS113_17460 [Verrucomicrobiales bacterium]|nr:hypothetical protein [Verrucomicrobiales bacterium]